MRSFSKAASLNFVLFFVPFFVLTLRVQLSQPVPKKEKLHKFSAQMYSSASFTRLPSGYVPDLIAIACFIARALKSAFSA